MWPNRLSNPGPLAFESDALPTVLCGPAYIVISYSLRQIIGILIGT